MVPLLETQVLVTLNSKRREFECHVGSLERDMEQARRDLSAILAAIKVFSADGPRVTAYMNLSRLFPRRELPKLALEALTASTPAGLSTVAIATYVIAAKGMDGGDRHLRKAIAYKAVQLMRRWERERKVRRNGKEGSAVVWRSLGLLGLCAVTTRYESSISSERSNPNETSCNDLLADCGAENSSDN